MARERPKASDEQYDRVNLNDAAPRRVPVLTRAEAHALRRCEPLTRPRLTKRASAVVAQPQGSGPDR